MYKRVSVLLISCLVGFQQMLLGAADPETLARAIPDDAFFFMQEYPTEKDDFIEAHYQRVWTQLINSGVPEDLFGLIVSSIEDDAQREMVETEVAKFKELLGKIQWSEMADEGFVMTERLRPPAGPVPPITEIVLLFQGTQAEANYSALKSIVEQIASYAPDQINVVTSSGEDQEMVQLVVPAPMTFAVKRQGDVILFSNSAEFLANVSAGLADPASVNPLVEQERFVSAFEGLPEPHTLKTFVDLGHLLGVMEDFLIPVLEQASEQDPNAAAGLALAQTVLKESKTISRIASVKRVEGLSVVETVRIQTGPDSEDTLLYRSMTSNPSIETWNRLIPAEATSFSANSGVDLEVLYTGIRQIVEEKVPDGQNIIAQVDQQLAGMGIDLQRDVFSWLEGRCVQFTLPEKAGFVRSSATLISVKDEEAARQTIDRLLNTLNGLMVQNMNQGLMRMPSATLGEDFEIVTHQNMAMFIRPVIGVENGYLYIATTENAIAKSLATWKGEHPNILTNERYQAEGVAPEGQVRQVSFKDLSGLGSDLAQAIAMVGMVGGFASANPDVPPQVPQIISMISRLSPVVGQIDFLRSGAKASVWTGDGWLEIKKTTYAPPKPTPTPTPVPGDEAEATTP